MYILHVHVRSSNLLVTIHNLCCEDLLVVLRLGGLPTPSLGVTKVETPFTDFGEISQIGTLSMVDPSRTPVYSRDAYTVTSPKNDHGHPTWPTCAPPGAMWWTRPRLVSCVKL